jgi:hypothetical protein
MHVPVSKTGEVRCRIEVSYLTPDLVSYLQANTLPRCTRLLCLYQEAMQNAACPSLPLLFESRTSRSLMSTRHSVV